MTPWMHELLRHAETLVTLPLCLLAALFVHECGHYVAARLAGLRVERVTFGVGRTLWSRQDSAGTDWHVNLWPLRAHVHIERFEDPSMSFRKKLVVILAGPLANFMLPLLLLFVFFASFGVPSSPTIVTSVERGMPAYEAGLRPGDRILSVNGEAVHSLRDLLVFTRPAPSAPLQVTYERDGGVRETSVMPEWASYRDIKGVRRGHGRIGLSTWQQPYELKVVRSVNGIATTTEDEARTQLLAHMGQRVEIGLYSVDGVVRFSLIDLSADANRHLGDPVHLEHDRLYIGALRDNYYLPVSPAESMGESAARTVEMIGRVFRLPFNLFPIDKSWITPDAVVSSETSYVQVRLYVFVFFASLCSCFIGLLNLLPLPQLDGGQALLLISERIKRRPLSLRERAALVVFSLLFIYAAVFGLNMTDLRGYYLFQTQKAAAEAIER